MLAISYGPHAFSLCWHFALVSTHLKLYAFHFSKITYFGLSVKEFFFNYLDIMLDHNMLLLSRDKITTVFGLSQSMLVLMKMRAGLQFKL